MILKSKPILRISLRNSKMEYLAMLDLKSSTFLLRLRAAPAVSANARQKQIFLLSFFSNTVFNPRGLKT